jgi:hypothetical protein
MNDQPKPEPKRRHHCAYCGDDMGPWNAYSRRGDCCGKGECQNFEREEARAEREEAHEQLDRDLGYDRW